MLYDKNIIKYSNFFKINGQTISPKIHKAKIFIFSQNWSDHRSDSSILKYWVKGVQIKNNFIGADLNFIFR
jgi:hypothetical protein